MNELELDAVAAMASMRCRTVVTPSMRPHETPRVSRESYGGFATVSFTRRDLPLYFESDDVQIAGLVVSNYSADPSHWASQQSLGNWLAKAGVPAIFGVDTRALTKGLRERGSILGRLEVEGAPPSPPSEVGFVDPNLRNLVAEVSTKSIRTYNQGGDKPTIVAIDCGMKHNIVRYFVETHDVTLVVVPFDYDLEANPL